MTEKNVWVTGATGYLGAGFIQFLRLQGVNCRQLDFRHSGYFDFTFDKSDSFFHFGDPSTNDKTCNDEDELRRQDLIIQEFLELTQMRSFYISSALVYGLNGTLDFKTEDTIKPFNAYTRMKARREEIFASRGAKVLRISNTYGGNRDSKSLIIRVINHYLKGVPFNFQKSNGIRDYIFVHDVYEALSYMMWSIKDSRTFLNIGTGRGVSVSTVKSLVENELGLRPIKSSCKNHQEESLDRNVLDVSGDCVPQRWMPRTPLHLGIAMEISRRRGNVG